MFDEDIRRFQQFRDALLLHKRFSSSFVENLSFEKSNSSGNLSASFGYRNFNAQEISSLESRGNVAHDWNTVFISNSVSYQSIWNRISGCKFFGEIFCFSTELDGDCKNSAKKSETNNNCTIYFNNMNLMCGLYNSTFYGTVLVSNSCLIQDCSFVSNTIMQEYSALIRCGSVSASINCNYAIGTKIQVGNEVLNNREVIACPGFSYIHYIRSCMDSIKYQQEIKDVMPNFESDQLSFSIFSQNSIFFNCSIVSDICCYRPIDSPSSIHVINCNRIENCCLFSSSSSSSANLLIDGASEVKNCLLQDMVHIGHNCSVVNSVLMDESHADCGCVIVDSILGPDSSVSIGECRQCLLGPMVGFHHNSLLISSLWPLGRGNLSCGALVGSNHTGRVSDQEAYLGEGIFFGLGSLVKFPCNLLSSPHSIIAPGTVLPPCKLEFPFSLISDMKCPPNSLPKSLISCTPGWVLLHSAYTIDRSQSKYSKRRKSSQIHSDFPIWRPWTIDRVIAARNDLRNALQDHPSTFHFCGRQLTCLGDKNDESVIVSMEAARFGVDIYTEYICRYALSGFAELLSNYAELKANQALSLPNIIQFPRHELFDGDEFCVNLQFKNVQRLANEANNIEQCKPLLRSNDDDAWFDASSFEWDSVSRDAKPNLPISSENLAESNLPSLPPSHKYVTLDDGYDSGNDELTANFPDKVDQPPSTSIPVISSTADDVELKEWLRDVVTNLYPINDCNQYSDDESDSICSQLWLSILNTSDKSIYDQLHIFRVLRMEYGRESWCLEDLMKEYMNLEDNHAARVLKSRKRDWERGKRVFADYEAIHGVDIEDAIVNAAWSRSDFVRDKAEHILSLFCS